MTVHDRSAYPLVNNSRPNFGHPQAARRAVALAAIDEGLTMREAGLLLEISHQRVKQLVDIVGPGGTKMGKSQSPFTRNGIADLAKNKPVVYKIVNSKGKNIYTGVAKRGRIEQRLSEHLPGQKDAIPGASRVKITQHDSIRAAEKSETRIIKQAKPRHNKKGNPRR